MWWAKEKRRSLCAQLLSKPNSIVQEQLLFQCMLWNSQHHSWRAASAVILTHGNPVGAVTTTHLAPVLFASCLWGYLWIVTPHQQADTAGWKGYSAFWNARQELAVTGWLFSIRSPNSYGYSDLMAECPTCVPQAPYSATASLCSLILIPGGHPPTHTFFFHSEVKTFVADILLSSDSYWANFCSREVKVRGCWHGYRVWGWKKVLF